MKAETSQLGGFVKNVHLYQPRSLQPTRECLAAWKNGWTEMDDTAAFIIDEEELDFTTQSLVGSGKYEL
jgi:hypothetical protein